MDSRSLKSQLKSALKSPLKSPLEGPQMHTKAPAVLAVAAEELSAGDPPADKPAGAELRQKGSGLTGLFTRLQTGIRARRVHVHDKNRQRSSVLAAAAKRFNRIASWLHACRIACRSSTDGHGLHDPYGTLRSEEEWSTYLNSADTAAAQDPGDFKEVEL